MTNATRQRDGWQTPHRRRNRLTLADSGVDANPHFGII
jgi:hypothetical protein